MDLEAELTLSFSTGSLNYFSAIMNATETTSGMTFCRIEPMKSHAFPQTNHHFQQLSLDLVAGPCDCVHLLPSSI